MTSATGSASPPRGLTLAELCVALAVLALTAALAWPRWSRLSEHFARDAARRKLADVCRRAALGPEDRWP